MSIMEIKQVGYSYDNKKKVLKGVNAEMEQGKLYAILGPSGCGKTTLLSLIGGLDSPGSGQIYFDGQDIAKTGLSDHRKNHVAFIFQAYNLIDYLTPAENVSLTSKLPPLPILERLGLTKEEAKRNVLKLSGGQQQRVAIARALASEAPVILADELPAIWTRIPPRTSRIFSKRAPIEWENALWLLPTPTSWRNRLMWYFG